MTVILLGEGQLSGKPFCQYASAASVCSWVQAVGWEVGRVKQGECKWLKRGVCDSWPLRVPVLLASLKVSGNWNEGDNS